MLINSCSSEHCSNVYPHSDGYGSFSSLSSNGIASSGSVLRFGRVARLGGFKGTLMTLLIFINLSNQ